jgi:5-methylcytosine-specific restriction endonuclease McrA
MGYNHLMYKYIRAEDGTYIKNPMWGKLIKDFPPTSTPTPLTPTKKPETPILNQTSQTRTPKSRPKRSHPKQKPINGWSRIRHEVLNRDGYVCRICFSDAVEAQLHVHHIDYNRAHNHGDNLVTLCRACHFQVHLERYMPEPDTPLPWRESID